MGVPYFFRHVITSHQGLLRPLARRQPPPRRLFIDFNGLIYTAAAKLEAQPPDEAAVVLATVAALDHLVAAVRATDLVYVAVDGVCPVAKMEQQRSRRFISAAPGNGGDAVPPSSFTGLCATPGTAFMARLNSALHDWACSEQGCRRLVSDSLQPGEGEHKIMDYLRGHPGGGSGDMDLVWGLDADLILLCLLRAPAAPCVLRADEHGELQVLDVPRLGRELCAQQAGGEAGFIPEFVALVTLAGNDFVPPLSFVRVGAGGVQHLLRAYKDTAGAGAGPLVSGAQLNARRLGAIVQCLVRHEAEGLAFLKDKHLSRRPGLISDSVLPVVTFDALNARRAGWRSDYYATLFPRSVMQASTVAADYVRGLRWVTRYYTLGGGAVDWTWAYPHAHSPTCQDLANYLHVCDDDDDDSRGGGPPPWLTPDFQLLAVLPPGERLVPAPLRRIATDLELGCVHMYPTAFQLDGFLKTRAWECHARLPRLDVDKLLCAIAALNQSAASPRQ